MASLDVGQPMEYLNEQFKALNTPIIGSVSLNICSRGTQVEIKFGNWVMFYCYKIVHIEIDREYNEC